MWTDALRSMFTPESWAQGVGDSMMNRIIAINTQGDRISGVVSYDRKYIVTIDLTNENHPLVTCTCRQRLCSHAACVCSRVVLLEERANPQLRSAAAQAQRNKPAPKPAPKPKPEAPVLTPLFPPAAPRSSSDYRNVQGKFDLRRICSGMTLTTKQAKAVEPLLPRVFPAGGMSLSAGYNSQVLSGVFEIRPGQREEPVRVRVDLLRSGIEECICSEHGRVSYPAATRFLCPHMIAALYCFDGYLQSRPMGDDTDSAGLRLLNMLHQGSLAASAPETQPADGQTLSLEPVLGWGGDIPELTFRLGTKRKYVVRNLQTLVEAVDGGQTLEMGKEGHFDFSRDRFDEESQGWMEMIRAGVTEALQARESLQRRTRWEIPKAQVGSLELSGSRLESFFDRFTPGSEIPAGKTSFHYREGRPPVRLVCEATRSGKTLTGLRLKGDPGEWQRGATRVYHRLGQTITAVNPEECRTLMALRKANPFDALDMRFGLLMLNEFLRHILPALDRECEVTRVGLDALEPFIAPEAALTFYLDADNTGLTCRAEAAYGEEKAPLDNDCSGFAYADTALENQALKAIRQSFPEYDAKARVHRAPGTEEALYALLTGGVDRLRALGEVQVSDRFSRLRVRRNWNLNVGVRLESGLLRLSLSSDALSPEEITEILSQYTPKKKFHRLRSGDLVSLEESAGSLQELMEAMHLSAAELRRGDLRLPAYRALYLDRVLEEASGVYAQRDRSFRKLIASFKTVSDSDLEVPASLENVLRPYQKTGYRWLMTLALSGFGGILADDMGLGKTVQVIAMILARKENGLSQAPSLVVCPASLVYNWLAEVQKFAPQLKAVPLAGTAAQRRELFAAGDADIYITSYGTALRDAALHAEKRFDCLVLDEAQAIKTHTAAQSKAVRQIPAEHRFALTGTPIENRLSELWSIFDCLMPGFLYEYAVFRRELESPIAREDDEKASARLKRMVQPFILRRLKGDVLKDLPAKLEEQRMIEMEDEQRRLYSARAQQLRQTLAAESDESYNNSKLQVLAELTRLRQLCCDPALVYEEYKALSAKREALLDMLTTLRDSGHKTLVFSQFPSLLHLVEEDLKREGLPYMLLTGSTSKQDRLMLVDRFNRDDTPVFLISLKAGGTGLNLTGADTVIHYDPWWNLAAQNQATDRAHRIGQDKVVTVFKLIARNTIEEKIVALQERKRDLADAILSGDMGGFASLSREELLEIVGGK